PHGPGVAFRHPRIGDFWLRPALRDPPLPRRSTRTGSSWDVLFADAEAGVAHDIAAARAPAIGPGLLDLRPPTGLPSRRRPRPRKVLDQTARSLAAAGEL